MLLDWLWAAAGIVLATLGVFNHRHLRAALAPRPAPPRLETYPSISVIRPVKGLDPEADENTRAALRHGYPGPVQTLFVFDDESDPALPIIQQVIAESDPERDPGSCEILFCGEPQGRTGKLNAMVHGLARARGEVVAFVDSDVRWDRDALRIAVETLAADPKAGSASAPVVVTPAPVNLTDACLALLLNGLYGTGARAATMEQDGELTFILGQLMVFRREALHAINNLEDIAGNFVDDIQIGHQVSNAGFRNLVTSHPIGIIWLGSDWKEFIENFRRWMTFSRGFDDWSFPRPIAWRTSVFFGGFIGAVSLAATGHGLAAIPWWIAAAVVTGSLVLLHEQMGGAKLRPRHWISPAVLLLIIPFIFARVYTQRSVSWRGRSYRLDGSGRLADRKR
ncbi:MAG: glycosyltransferase [Deltaproteobacteria bacterium]|nr:glycosyltransferase [Deltaproteobacteria bacterium]